MIFTLFLPKVKKETSSPSKKKKAKSSDVGNAEAVPAEETKIVDNNEKTPEGKPSNKEQKAEVEMYAFRFLVLNLFRKLRFDCILKITVKLYFKGYFKNQSIEIYWNLHV